MTYTLLVLLAGLLAKGDAGGREGLARFLLAAGIVLAPQLGATSTLLQAPDHTGTAVRAARGLAGDRPGPAALAGAGGGLRHAGLDHGGRLDRAADRHRADRRGRARCWAGRWPSAARAGLPASCRWPRRRYWRPCSARSAPLIIRAAGGYTCQPRCRATSWASAACRGRHGWRSTPRSTSSAPTCVAAHSGLELAFAVLHLAGAALAGVGRCASRRCGSSAPANCSSRHSRLAIAVNLARVPAHRADPRRDPGDRRGAAARRGAGRTGCWPPGCWRRSCWPPRLRAGEGAPGTAAAGAGGGRGGLPGGARVRCGAARRARHERAAGDLAGRHADTVTGWPATGRPAVPRSTPAPGSA